MHYLGNNSFDHFNTEKQLKIVSKIDLDVSIKEQFDFFGEIASSNKYSDKIKELAKAKLRILIQRKKEAEDREHERDKLSSDDNQIKKCLQNIERLANKMEKRVKKGKHLKNKDIKWVRKHLLYIDNDVFVKFYQEKKGVKKKIITDARNKLQKLRNRIDKIIEKDKNNIKQDRKKKLLKESDIHFFVISKI